MQAFPRMVIDRCTEIFQITTRSPGSPASLHILPARLRIHLSQHVAAEEIVQATDPVRELRYFRLRGASFGVNRLAMSVMDSKHIGDVDVFNVAEATRRAVLRGDILYEGVFGGFRSASLAKTPVATSRSPSRMVQTALAMRRPFLLLAFRL